MAKVLNPFPDLPVRPLSGGDAVEKSTVQTASIVQARSLVEAFASGTASPSSSSAALLLRVSGDYGSGKTHLVIYVISLAERLAFPTIVFRAACTETDVMSWFRTAIVPRLRTTLSAGTLVASPDERKLEELLTNLYAEAAADVASKANLTAPLIDELKVNPARVREIIDRNLLNDTAVEEHFQRRLAGLFPGADEEVLAAFAALKDPDKARLGVQWLCGDSLSESELSALRVRKALSTEQQVADLLTVIAALAEAVGHVFIFAVDEFEHFTRFDEHHSLGNNATWTKRLLESLSQRRAIAIVSGHSSAWKKKPDVLDRFTDSLELHPVTGDEVMRIINLRTDGRLVSSDVCEAIAEAARGNIRRVLSLCRLLYNRAQGGIETLTVNDVLRTALALARRIELSDVNLAVHSAAERVGFTVHHAHDVDGIPFDVVAFSGERVRMVAEIKHATTPRASQEAARLFNERYREVADKNPGLVGVFVADGAVDEEYLDRLRASLPHCVWINLDETESVAKVEEQVATALTAAARDSGEPAEVKDETNDRRGIANKELEDLEARSREQDAALQARLAIHTESSAGHLAPQSEEVDDRRSYETYKELTDRPFAAGMSHLLRGMSIPLLVVLVTAILLVVFLPDTIIARVSGYNPHEESLLQAARESRQILYCIIAFGAFLAALTIYLQYRRFDAFIRERSYILRQLYLRGAPREKLFGIHDLSERILAKRGPVRGIPIMNDEIRRLYPDLVISHL